MTRTSVLALTALAALSSSSLVSTDASAGRGGFHAPAFHAPAAAPRMNAFHPATSLNRPQLQSNSNFKARSSFATTRFSTQKTPVKHVAAPTSFRPAKKFTSVNGNGNGNHNVGGVNGNGNGNHNVGGINGNGNGNHNVGGINGNGNGNHNVGGINGNGNGNHNVGGINGNGNGNGNFGG